MTALDKRVRIQLPSAEDLNSLLHYEANTGLLYWKHRPLDMFKCVRTANSWNSRYGSKEAFTCISAKGYKSGTIFDRNYQAHRIIWVMVYSEDPGHTVDHINGDASDNRLSNLRKADHSSNMRNSKKSVANTSGFKGVSLHKQTGKWIARIRSEGKYLHLGLFSKISDAKLAYENASKTFHGQFGRLE